jgi:hypothetical protein
MVAAQRELARRLQAEATVSPRDEDGSRRGA